MKSKPNPRPTDEERLLFEEFWRAYPSGKKGRKDRAQRAFVAAVRRGTEVSDDRPGGFTAAENFEVIMAGVERYARHCRYEFYNRGELALRYQLHAQTFIEKERWVEAWPTPFDPAEKIDTDDPDEVERMLVKLGCRS
jgi:hypothetical protein